ncbi:MAG: hypothetical protein ACLTPF_07350 [Collinsella stercoris]
MGLAIVAALACHALADGGGPQSSGDAADERSFDERAESAAGDEGGAGGNDGVGDDGGTDKEDGTGDADTGGTDGDNLRRIWELLDGPGQESSARSFLEDLSQGEGERDDGDATTAIVYWTERGDLPVAAERVLDAYADVGGVILGASGYLDMYGNVWGALVRRGDAWCDVVLVSTEDGEQSVVRVARVLAGSV